MIREKALAIFLTGVEVVKPGHFIPRHIRINEHELLAGDRTIHLDKIGKVYVAAVGKASSAMAEETEKILQQKISDGLVITKYGHALPLNSCRTIESGHPIPDENSLKGGEAMISFFKKTNKGDLIILLVSGGASALMADAPPACTLTDIQITGQLLLDCGADIEEINTIRKHLSAIKGGQLMQYTQATVVALILSDAPGDDLSVIASGLTAPDNTTFEDAWKIIEKYRLQEELPVEVRTHLLSGRQGSIPDTPKSGSPIFQNVHNTLVATNRHALDAAARKAGELGYRTTILYPALSGEADEKAREFTEVLLRERKQGPVCVLWGGESTVTMKGKGKGGRNQQFALAALNYLKKEETIKEVSFALLAGGTDGTDGPTDAAGAIITRQSLEKAADLQISPEAYLGGNDSYHFFEKTGDLIKTGPTQTNVMDLIVGLID